MASLVKPWVVRYVDAAGKRCKSTDPGARQVKERAAKWHGQGVPGMPPRKRVPLATSKPVAQRMLDDLVRKAERGLANMPDPGRGLVALSGLLDEYLEAVRRGSSAKHARTVVGGARGVFDRAGLVTLNDLSAADVVARAEAAVWALVEPPASLTPKTAAYHGKYARSFTRWLWRKKGLLGSDPLAGMAPRPDDGAAAAPPDARRAGPADRRGGREPADRPPPPRPGPRRALPRRRRDRAAGRGTGRPDARALRPGGGRAGREAEPGRDEEREAGRPAAPPGRRRAAPRVPGGRPATRPVWPGLWWHKAATMMRVDMAAAGIPASAGGEEVVFHSLRHSYTTLLARVAPVKVTQELARHSTPVLTIGTYSHTGMAEKAEAVGRMQLPGANPAGEVSRADLAGMVLVLAAVFDAVVAPPVAPALRSPGAGGGRMGTDVRGKTPPGGNEETPGFPGV